MSGRPRAERVETLGRRGGIRPRPSSVCQNGGSRGPGLTLSSGSTGPSGLCSRAVTAQVWNRVQALGPRRGSAARLFCAERGKAHRQLLGLWLLLVEGAPLPHNGAGRGPRSGKEHLRLRSACLCAPPCHMTTVIHMPGAPQDHTFVALCAVCPAPAWVSSSGHGPRRPRRGPGPLGRTDHPPEGGQHIAAAHSGAVRTDPGVQRFPDLAAGCRLTCALRNET